MASLVNSHTNATRIGWYLWEIDLRFALSSTPGWLRGLEGFRVQLGLYERGVWNRAPLAQILSLSTNNLYTQFKKVYDTERSS